MADFFDYLTWRGDIPFAQVPPTPVDTLIFSERSWAELDWLDRFLRDPLVGRMLDADFHGELCKWLEYALNIAVTSGYV